MLRAAVPKIGTSPGRMVNVAFRLGELRVKALMCFSKVLQRVAV